MRLDQRKSPREAAAWWRREAQKEIHRLHPEPEFRYVAMANADRCIVSDPMKRHERQEEECEFHHQAHCERRLP